MAGSSLKGQRALGALGKIQGYWFLSQSCGVVTTESWIGTRVKQVFALC